ncbi:hypothetical protein BDR06DRAFT_967921 [Suillus hirtellus]|nr:hypothetical protein BDR06DRAFT_967921 [Suillus hirtellus]
MTYSRRYSRVSNNGRWIVFSISVLAAAASNASFSGKQKTSGYQVMIRMSCFRRHPTMLDLLEVRRVSLPLGSASRESSLDFPRFLWLVCFTSHYFLASEGPDADALIRFGGRPYLLVVGELLVVPICSDHVNCMVGDNFIMTVVTHTWCSRFPTRLVDSAYERIYEKPHASCNKLSRTGPVDLLPNAEEREELDADDFNYFDYCTCP